MYGQATTIEEFVLLILAVVVIVIFGGAIAAFFIAIFQFIFSKGDSEKIKKAWNTIRYMLLGIILTILLLFIFPVVFERLEIPGHEQYTAQNIFEKAGELVQHLISGEGLESMQSTGEPAGPTGPL
ncbi:chloride channel protein [Candidatus Absconditicoccus praedator]|uniref:chloride channel protein n=1 Tax=Candidatus Absconditicoccus praedator TaxID=2735562 RepID=UPI001E62FFB2|nr:chloride channel protein [Candidatus Absconditicoccus praedator]UFX83088.1 hypothetical protein HLG78_03055 [Candidatus Absconditicoccus praedator]